MTLPEFSKVFGVLAIQLGKTDADEITIRSYFKALQDLDIELIAMAAERLGSRGVNEKGEAWFPKAPEWREAAESIERARLEQQRARIRERQKAGLPPLCFDCDDTGFARNEAANRVHPCACRKLRRLEILGRRPMPALPEMAS